MHIRPRYATTLYTRLQLTYICNPAKASHSTARYAVILDDPHLIMFFSPYTIMLPFISLSLITPIVNGIRTENGSVSVACVEPSASLSHCQAALDKASSQIGGEENSADTETLYRAGNLTLE